MQNIYLMSCPSCKQAEQSQPLRSPPAFSPQLDPELRPLHHKEDADKGAVSPPDLQAENQGLPPLQQLVWPAQFSRLRLPAKHAGQQSLPEMFCPFLPVLSQKQDHFLKSDLKT